MADQGKTEQATQRRLKKARDEGEFPNAREFVLALQFCVFLGLLEAGGAAWFAAFRQTARQVFSLPFSGRDLHAADVTHLAWVIFLNHVAPMLAAGLAVAAATLGFRLVTTRFGLSLKKLAPQFSRLDPIAKLKQLPGQNLPATVQASIMLPIFLWAVYVVARDHIEQFLSLPFQSVASGFAVLNLSLLALFWKAAGVFLVVGAVDLLRQIKRHNAQLRMSKQDIRDEYKETDGSPLMKAKIRRIQRDRARRQMMKEVPTATAVVVNPTHYAVAIRYSLESNTAPLVVAKGKNYLARRIRQKAIENQVPIVENPPLARALYQACEPGQEIPPQLYRAVAEILAYIYKLMNGPRRG
jgi:flagellar biosynthetic protein FlhB